MECNNNLCVYESDGNCTLEIITVDEVGMCSCCIYPEIEESVLNSAKKELLQKLSATDI